MSLLEVVVVMALFAVLYAIAVPNLQAMRAPYALDAAAYQLAGHLNMARQRAIARNSRHRVTFSPSGYQIEREVSSNSFVVDSGVFEPPYEVEIGTPTPADPTFNSRGMLTGDVSIPISVNGVGTKTVMTNVLGHTKIQ